ncbi:AraC family transcriptional regulator [Paraburkholderia sp. 22099]|jgi:AraC-like DNA-binding protein|nr:AraC family transcriptional regulator [Paraburkholderia terricola]MDR6445186.1 AraC-like DNA-binding protein [Paraburkholderia terricola]MDR6479046.1 AraC-like DNA-binding protein [Paraburkholderia terricola]
MKNPHYMIERPSPTPKVDRLSAFFRAFDLSVQLSESREPDADALLLVLGDSHRQAEQVALLTGERAVQASPSNVLVAASVYFGGAVNPIVSAMPEDIQVGLSEAPTLRAITDAFVEEALDARCGRTAALGRLCEVIVLMILRRAIDNGATQPGLLAGLSHPALHRALVALHDAPARIWRIEELAEIAGMSRSRFMVSFRETVGTTPAAYLSAWRLKLAHRALAEGARVKSVALRVGFGSAAAFSRAYSREFGYPPAGARHE